MFLTIGVKISEITFQCEQQKDKIPAQSTEIILEYNLIRL